MSGNNDLELNLSPIKKPTASRGRRANNSATKQGTLCLLCQELPLKVLRINLFRTLEPPNNRIRQFFLL